MIISIHAPHAGRDYPGRDDRQPEKAISIHAPHAGRDLEAFGVSGGQTYFNPRAPCGARLGFLVTNAEKRVFQSTRPMRGATRAALRARLKVTISIHAPHAGRDENGGRGSRCGLYFNPRAPCGARLIAQCSRRAHTLFQSTRPMRGATSKFKALAHRVPISIHAPHAGRDSKSEQIALHIFAKKAWIPDIFAQNAAFQSVLPLADRQKLLYLRCEPLRKFLRAFASHYKIIGSSGR